MKLKIVFFGTPNFVVPVLDVLQKNFDLVGVVTTPDAPTGRKKILAPTPIKAHFLKTNPQGLVISSQQFSNETIEQLQNLHLDLFVVAAYGHLVAENVLRIPKYGSLNIHPSLLPKYRGPSPIQSAILNGDQISGITIIKMDEELDHGPIITQKEMPLSDTDTFESLKVKMFEQSAAILPSIIDRFVKDKITPKEQDHKNATYCEHITKLDGYFDSNNPPSFEKLNRMTRAYYPWPTAWTRIKIMNNESRIIKLLPGKRIQLEGGKPMTEKEFVNGYPEAKQLLAQLFAR
ncbi:MAG TPA: methionyl-tRNA formyltransferase [Candidatus Nanoarchaeia archaeon]|nr:methionyl-tRNA formyltransferase [Candidatus Nanoarchaeia archaeon]